MIRPREVFIATLYGFLRVFVVAVCGYCVGLLHAWINPAFRLEANDMPVLTALLSAIAFMSRDRR